MTLVVVQKTPIGIVAIADTKLSPPSGKGIKLQPYKDAGLKLHMLSPSMLLAFADNVYLAQKALDLINQVWPVYEEILFDELSSLLIDFCKENIDIEFIIVDLNSSDIRKITSDSITRNCEKAYIGDRTAYQYYLNFYNEILFASKYELEKSGAPLAMLESMTMLEAFQKLLKNSGLVSVGEPLVRLMQEDNSFFCPPDLYASTGFSVIKKIRLLIFLVWKAAALQ